MSSPLQITDKTSSTCITTQAASYEAGSEIQQGIGIKMINMLNVEKGATVLDLGCGTGYLTKVLSERVGPEGKVVAVDPDGERLKIARENHSAGNIQYIQADDKTFPPGQYDLIFCNIVIHWIKDKKAVLKQIYKNLCVGGCFAFTTANGYLPIPEIGTALFNQLVGPHFLDWMTNEKMIFWNASEYIREATDTGFRQMSLSLIPHYPKWKNLDDYIDSMYGWFQGEFDPRKFDPETLLKIKKEYGNGPVAQLEPINILHTIVTKAILY
jgi:ubiquinone/menaquinone biosynthesis C-methylase UbiE